MSSFWKDSLRFSQGSPPLAEGVNPTRPRGRCTNFLEFLAVMFSDAEGRKIGMHPVMTSSSPTFSDVSMGVVYHDTGSPTCPRINPALVVEYAELGNLKSFQADGLGRDIVDKFDICHDIAEGLCCLHQCGVIHGDIKNTNILMCKHKTRNFVAKVSDFGFAISVHDENPRLVGHTFYLEAPEAKSPLQPKHLVQLDIYSYGLLLYTVMKNGTMFYDSIPVDGRSENVAKMKNSNLLPALLQANLLQTMDRDKCLLLLFCKVLAYCLRTNPADRFGNMRDVLDHLKWANPRDLDLSLHRNEDLYKVLRLPTSLYTESKDRILKAFNQQLDKYCEDTKLEMPLIEMLKDLYRRRMEREVEMIISKPTTSDATHYDICPNLDLTLWRFNIGLATYPQPPEKGVQAASKKIESPPTQILFVNQTMPDLSSHHDVLQKMSDAIKLFIVQELERLGVQDEDQGRAGIATYNLGYCYIAGIGVNEDIEVGIKKMEQAAKLGCERARKQLLRYYASEKVLDNLQQTNFALWSEDSLEERDKPALRMLATVAPDVHSHLRAQWALDRALVLDNASATTTVDRPLMTWRAQLLHFAASNDMPELLEQMLQAEPAIINAKNHYGQTPLIAACQSANLGIALYLLNNGSDVNARDEHGFTASHWLISFSHGEKQTIATSLGAENVDPNVYGLWPEALKEGPPNLHGGPAINGAPLHWAIACSDLAAVELLIGMGASASQLTQYRPTPLEYACRLSEASILLRLLEDAATKLAVAEYLPLQGSSGMIQINALFWVLCGTSQLARLIRHGRDFDKKTEQTIRCLIEAGCSCEGVLLAQSSKMSAPFATAFHHCNAEIMRAGLAHGFAPYIDTTFGKAASGGPAMSLALAHRDRKMFQYLLTAGASLTWRNLNKQPPLSMAAKETDDEWFAERLLEKGVELDDTEGPITAFWTAVYCGNLNMARFLWEKGAKRDSRNKLNGTTVLGQLVGFRTQNASERIRFILDLPDRDEGDGFEVLQSTDYNHDRISALHLACSPYASTAPFTEDPETEEGCRLVLSLLLRKFGAPEYVNSTLGPHHDVPLGLAVEIGNHHAVRLLLEAGADPNAQDEYSRTPLDKLYWRYCYPATLDVLVEVRDDKRKVAQRLAYVNRNTSEVLSLLTSYGAKANVFRFPSWHQSDPGYRSPDWVLARLQENAERPPVDHTTPMWGGMPISIPERPMQFEARRRLAEQQEAKNEKAQA
ncbi:hypothetical protein EPUS_05818 [Endocarpon pusillum Z07020]|uniref:Protein kinase domain-containing protein n=1 Tax=Endocarpon pusillum (strain Z07020 / HMAS-L-300199) TaxID=1263415 RepID=U1I532_ENDPU|nr:uncharacterized protein EPUS_05818 [Endocarpon pusillum Z07020]ERF77249.1 hypothetical protein EPUS_05818 [Endocarpon pusillum Z07020]